jgi:phosphoglycolate phosphatase-like HAD superfamily hydrolase
MVEILCSTGTVETEQELYTSVKEFVTELTGKQTIYQMIRLASELEKRGVKPQNPLVYKHEYNRRLLAQINHRRESLRAGTIEPENVMVPYTHDILKTLKNHGIIMYLASGTDIEYVREEARLLGIEKFFEGYIYGALDNYKSFSKQLIIDRILSKNRIEGSKLIVFGDGYVEIENGKSVGGTAIAVASDEASRSGKVDAWKYARLIRAGADIVMPDYRDYEILLDYLWKG